MLQMFCWTLAEKGLAVAIENWTLVADEEGLAAAMENC